ncbi:hypothetical protein ARMGADRAFT_1087965 [Armillaria gallica]|uniref:Uncharacterized protein n=1 Tax=Armillaria gallica TaxID=47427 RepID=A0A2H3CP61_ARMGA|nr:hypothetical protein ARMGADRAFT_1087965 [Armillaria gallica]
MSPDLTNNQVIALAATLAATITTTLGALLALAYTQQARNLLTRLGALPPTQQPQTNWATAPFPQHYVIPEPKPKMDWPAMATGTTMMTDPCTHWHMTTWVTANDASSFLSRENIPRNTTQGPSNVCRTLSPKSTTMDRDLWAEPNDPWSSTKNARIWPDPKYPAGTWDPDDIPELYRHWDQPMVSIYNIPSIPDAPQEPDPVLPYFTPDMERIPRACPRLLHPALND